MKKILVTGADGFIGKALCKKLARKFRVIALVLDKENTSKELTKIKNLELIEADITKNDLNNKIGMDFDFCVHLAGISDVNVAEKSPVLAAKVNIAGTKNILKACKKAKCRGIVFASTIKVYGKYLKHGIIYEDGRIKGESIYAKTKIKAEKEVIRFCKKNNIGAIIARQANVYGGGDLNSNRLIPATILRLLENKRPRFTSDPSTELNMPYLDDIIDFYLKSIAYLEKNKKQEIINATNSKNVLLIDVINSIAELMGKEIVKNMGDIKKIKLRFSGETAKKLLGWQAKTSLKKGLRKTITWYKEYYKHICTKSINN